MVKVHTSSVRKKRARVTLDLPIDVKAELDRTAKELKMTRTGVMTLAMQSVKAFRSPGMQEALENALKSIFGDKLKK